MNNRSLRNSGAKFLRFCGPVLSALQQLGGSGRPSEVEALVVEKGLVSSEEQLETLKDGTPRFHNQIHWARYYLAEAGYIERSKRGVWSLTAKGQRARFTDADARELFQIVRSRWSPARPEEVALQEQQSIDERAPEQAAEPEWQSHRAELISVLRNLSPSGFEKLCKRLLREAGFDRVEVTGRSGDGGIDGEGVLRINDFVTLRVMFQCKRYAGSVSPSHVRDFRGALAGRADKGVIITTGSFSADAQREAVRDGATPIELVDGDALVQLFEKLELGLLSKMVYEIRHEFFDEFR